MSESNDESYKEYDKEGRLTYEGGYLNGKYNGKGKEYDSKGVLRFVGIYLNGKKWSGKGYNGKGIEEYELKEGNGFCKEYDFYTGKTIFEGKYLNGERNGKGKEYNYDGKLIFEGEYLNGKRMKNNIIDYEVFEVLVQSMFFYIKFYIFFCMPEIFCFYFFLAKENNEKEKEYNDKLNLKGDSLNDKKKEKEKECGNNNIINFEGISVDNQKKEKEHQINININFKSDFLDSIIKKEKEKVLKDNIKAILKDKNLKEKINEGIKNYCNNGKLEIDGVDLKEKAKEYFDNFNLNIEEENSDEEN